MHQHDLPAAFKKIQKLCVNAFSFENAKKCHSEIALTANYCDIKEASSQSELDRKLLHNQANHLIKGFRKFYQLAKQAAGLVKTYNHKPIANHLRVAIDRAYGGAAKSFENMRKQRNSKAETIEKAYVDLYSALAHHSESIPETVKDSRYLARPHPLRMKIDEILNGNRKSFEKFAGYCHLEGRSLR